MPPGDAERCAQQKRSVLEPFPPPTFQHAQPAHERRREARQKAEGVQRREIEKVQQKGRCHMTDGQ